jgi:hypothetical protein
VSSRFLENLVRTCDVDGCDRKHEARGLCCLHYSRLRAPEAKKKREEDPIALENYRAYAREHYHKNKEKIISQRKLRALNNPETEEHKAKRLAHRREYRANLSDERKEAMAEYDRNWYLKVEKTDEYRAADSKRGMMYRLRHPDRCRERSLARNRTDRGNLADPYIKSKVRRDGTQNPTQKQIDAKRVDIIRWRELREAMVKNPGLRKERDKAKAEQRSKNLTDAYVKNYIGKKLGVKNPPQELIELKRVQIKIYRALK